MNTTIATILGAFLGMYSAIIGGDYNRNSDLTINKMIVEQTNNIQEQIILKQFLSHEAHKLLRNSPL